MQQVVVVANQTAVGAHLTQRLYELKGDADDIAVYIVVPATPRRGRGEAKTDSEGRPLYDVDGMERAGRQLRKSMEAVEKIGATVSGTVGAPDPMAAVGAAIEGMRVDRIVVSTLPSGVSRWVAMDLPHRLQRRFDVPVDHVVGKPAAETVEHTPKEGPISVLLVEDQPADVALTKAALDRADIDVELKVAKNGAEALEALRTYGQSQIDLVLLDLKMPVVDGHRFLEQAGGEEQIDLDALNVVVLTTSSSDADREKAHALGAGAYMIKDPDFEVFAESLLSVLAEVAAG